MAYLGCWSRTVMIYILLSFIFALVFNLSKAKRIGYSFINKQNVSELSFLNYFVSEKQKMIEIVRKMDMTWCGRWREGETEIAKGIEISR
jgi:hypothetical protein